MYINKDIDNGQIIHQIRPEISINDNIHTIGNKLILKVFYNIENLIKNIDLVKISKKIHIKKF